MRRTRDFFGKAYIGTAVLGDAVVGKCIPTTLAGCYLKTKHTSKKVQQIFCV